MGFLDAALRANDFGQAAGGLTDAEYQEILKKHDGAGLLAFYILVETKLKEKNT